MCGLQLGLQLGVSLLLLQILRATSAVLLHLDGVVVVPAIGLLALSGSYGLHSARISHLVTISATKPSSCSCDGGSKLTISVVQSVEPVVLKPTAQHTQLLAVYNKQGVPS